MQKEGLAKALGLHASAEAMVSAHSAVAHALSVRSYMLTQFAASALFVGLVT